MVFFGTRRILAVSFGSIAFFCLANDLKLLFCLLNDIDLSRLVYLLVTFGGRTFSFRFMLEVVVSGIFGHVVVFIGGSIWLSLLMPYVPGKAYDGVAERAERTLLRRQ